MAPTPRSVESGALPRPPAHRRATRNGDVDARTFTRGERRAGPVGRARAANIAVTTAHRTIVVADIEGFGQYWRNNANQVRLRNGMYQAMESAFDAVGIPWASCRIEDRGDGVLVLARAEIAKTLFVDRVPARLAAALARHNKAHPVEERIRLRLALHAGEVNFDDHGVTGAAINHAFRLIDADMFKHTFAESSAVLAIIGSGWFFDEVIRHSERSRVGSYQPAQITNKETTTRAWIRLLGKQVRPSHSPLHLI
jgi:hypothetical protein